MNWIGYATRHHETEVADALKDTGIYAWVAIEARMVRKGKQRWPELVEEPLWPNYIWINCPDERFTDMLAVKHLAPTFRAIPTQYLRHLRAIMDRVDEARADMRYRIDQGERIAHFAPGEPIKLSGPLADFAANFVRLVERPDSIFARIEAEVQVMGRTVKIDVDPLDVRRA
jgi:transcriptional antiterminator NusG